jgi:hypothetical protein
VGFETNKIVYLSPVVDGLQIGVGFQPNYTAENVGPVITSSPISVTDGGPSVKPRNVVDVGGQYTRRFGQFGLQIGADYITAGQTDFSGSRAFVTPTGFHDLSMVSGGVTMTYRGLTVGGNAVYGAFNPTNAVLLQLEPNGGASAVGWLVGWGAVYQRATRCWRELLPF